ncbi:unnamed protein product [Periconia digitata]|uniref:Nucleoside phosphorylase domain-containing protein n=1 Tax=Periconia digitata TaxID=1303443 RepID=A0A9W4UUL4_9PLEO|nr:unnamed protein product [Periconia digitata]
MSIQQCRLPREAYTVGWVCALPCELTAAVEMLDEEHENVDCDDGNLYTLGSINGHNVAIVCLPAGCIGNNPAATVATHMRTTFQRIRFALMVGIGGGVPSKEADIRLGDVVVSQPNKTSGGVVQYDMGRATPTGFVRTGSLNAPPRILLNAVAKIQANEGLGRSQISRHLKKVSDRNPRFRRERAGVDILFDAAYDHVGGNTCEECDAAKQESRAPRRDSEKVRTHYGVIASGNQVMRFATERDKVAEELGGGILCFEMEAAGLMSSFECLVIRGICDYSDSHKNKKWQTYAAGAAAAYAKEILSVLPATLSTSRIERQMRDDDEIRSEIGLEHSDEIILPRTRRSSALIPFRRDRGFVGRRDTLNQLSTKFEGESPKDHARVALVGLGGVGKSQIAIEYAYRLRDLYPDTWVFWVYAGNATRFKQAYRDIATRVELPGWDNPKSEILQVVYNWLRDENNGRWLMILDNADDDRIFTTSVDPESEPVAAGDMAPLESFLPQSSNGWILVTSRDQHTAMNLVESSRQLLQVDPMSEEEALLLLEKKAFINSRSETDDARVLVHKLEHMPLAITQAAAYMTANPMRSTPLGYLEIFQKSEEDQARLLKNAVSRDLRRDKSVPNAVFITWYISFNLIRDTNPKAAEMLSLMAMFDKKSIPALLLRPDRDVEVFEAAARTLSDFNLVKIQGVPHMFDMHGLVQLATKSWLKDHQKLEAMRQKALSVMASISTETLQDHTGAARVLFPHAQRTLDYVSEDSEAKINRAQIASSVAKYLQYGGEYAEAGELCRDAVVVMTSVLGEQNKKTLNCMAHLASIQYTRGNLLQAESLQRKVLEGLQKIGEAESPDMFRGFAVMGDILLETHNYDEAEEYIWQAVRGLQGTLGFEHKDTLRTCSSLLRILRTRGKHEITESMHHEIIGGLTKALGSEHLWTIASKAYLADFFTNRAKYPQAQKTWQDIIETTQKSHGTEHPQTLIATTKLGYVLDCQGKHTEGERLLRENFEKTSRILKNKHPQTLDNAYCLALALVHQDRDADAMGILPQTIKHLVEVYGPEDQYPRKITGMFVTLFKEKNLYREAEILEQILNCQEST